MLAHDTERLSRVPLAPLESHNQRPGRGDNQGPEETCTFQTLNESAGGYCLNWSGARLPKILIGELIGVRSSLAHQQFGIGLVRWIKNNPHHGMQLGLEMIAQDAIAIIARDRQASRDHPHHCLLLPAVGSSGQPSTLLSPCCPFKAGDLLILNDRGRTREIKLTRLLESSGAISQYQFIDLDGPAADKRSNS